LGVVTFTLGAIASGASAIATVTASTPTPGLVTNRASVGAATADLVPVNNSAVVTARINAAPTIQTIGNRAILEDATDNLSFTISDLETPAANLLVTASSSNPA